MSRDTEIGVLFDTIRDDVQKLINNRLRLVKLEIFEKTSVTTSMVIYGLIVVNIIFFTLLFAFIALGFYFSNLVGSYAGGFGLVVLLYLILLGVVLALRKKITALFENVILQELDPELIEELRQNEAAEEKSGRDVAGKGGEQ